MSRTKAASQPPADVTSGVRAVDAQAAAGPMDVLRALSDPVRWSIVRQLGDVDELACSSLEHTLNVSKPTISYHTKILVHAGLMSVRKEGRHFFYTLRPEALRSLVEDVWALAPAPVPVQDGLLNFRPAASARRRRPVRPTTRVADGVAAGAEHDPVVLTW